MKPETENAIVFFGGFALFTAIVWLFLWWMQ
jgi:hypothetical protein